MSSRGHSGLRLAFFWELSRHGSGGHLRFPDGGSGPRTTEQTKSRLSILASAVALFGLKGQFLRKQNSVLATSPESLEALVQFPVRPFLRWDEKAGLRRDAICSQLFTRSRRNGKETGLCERIALW